MGLNFEGSLDDISERQLAFIEEVLVKKGFNNTKATINPVGAVGDNYMANVKRITVSDDNGTLKMIAKIAPQNEIKRQLTNTQNLFKNEHVMYTEILPKFQELEVEAELPNEDRLRFPVCYGSCTEAPHEIILLEDLQVSNFVMLDRLKPLSNECIKSVLKNFAILHSLSHVLKSKEPETFETMKEQLFDLWATSEENRDMLASMNQLQKQTELLIEGEERKLIIKDAITQALLSATGAKSETDSKYSVIQQGDSWTNNIMFKFDGDKLKESVMIDYQLAKEKSPAYDLQYMIFNCSDHKMRLEHFHDWLDYYYSEFDKYLSNFGLKAKFVYPKDQLDADMKRYAKLMFGLSILLASVCTINPEDAVKIRELMETKINPDDVPHSLQFEDFDQCNMSMYKLRIEELIDSYLEFGLLENKQI